MRRSFFLIVAAALCLVLSASAQTAPKSTDTSKSTDTTKSTDTSKTTDGSKTTDDSKKSAAERFPFPGDAPTPQSPDSGKQKPAAEKFPFPGAESPDSPPRSDAPAKDTSKPNSAADEFPFPEAEAPTAPPHSEQPRGPNDSSSKDNRRDISPPPGDEKHDGVIAPDPAPGVVEMLPWNPHQADKDVEVGMYYFKQKNYFAAESRFREALHWQDNHAEAMYRLGTVLEKEGKTPEAEQYYLQYLRILPEGEFAKDIRKALERMGVEGSKKAQNQPPTSQP
jgi:tetratricopeptide (TPR) repeat protein